MVVEEVFEMWWLPLAMVLVAFGAAVYVLWPRDEDAPRRTDGQTSVTTTGKPETLEGVLVAQLAAAEINQRQYVRGMEQLAARDDERHPLSVPPETEDSA